MKLLRKFVSYLLICTFVQGQTSPAFSQTLQQPDASNSRVSGSSFGSKDEVEKQLPIQPPPTMTENIGLQQQSLVGLAYQIHVLGEVQRPGTYRMTASTRLSEALQVAGGILERGSDRRIELRRKDGSSRREDLLSFKVFGNLDANPYLMDNDVIFVPLKKKTIQIEGTVKRPGVYELKNERTLEDVLKLAGGTTVGMEGLIKVVRFEGGQKEIIEVENFQTSRRAFLLRDGDVIVFPHFLTGKNEFDYDVAKLPGENKLFYPSYEERVFVLGAVTRPGPYTYNPYYDLRQYLTLAGGTTKLAKPKKVKVISALGKTSKANANTEINPGDTIVIPEKYMAPENVVSLVLGITTSILGITTTVLTLSR